MRCPICGEQYAFFETRCTRCNVALVAEDDENTGASPATNRPTGDLVAVFKTDDAGLLPLAELALRDEGIPYMLNRTQRGVDNMSWALSLPPTIRTWPMQVLVQESVAAKARSVLADLQQATPAELTVPVAEGSVSAPIHLETADTNTEVGAITDDDLQELTSHLEEEAPQEYFVDRNTIELLEQAHVNAGLVDLLRRAIGDGEGRPIRWVVR
jgi:hypothetical protein